MAKFHSLFHGRHPEVRERARVFFSGRVDLRDPEFLYGADLVRIHDGQCLAAGALYGGDRRPAKAGIRTQE